MDRGRGPRLPSSQHVGGWAHSSAGRVSTRAPRPPAPRPGGGRGAWGPVRRRRPPPRARASSRTRSAWATIRGSKPAARPAVVTTGAARGARPARDPERRPRAPRARSEPGAPPAGSAAATAIRSGVAHQRGCSVNAGSGHAAGSCRSRGRRRRRPRPAAARAGSRAARAPRPGRSAPGASAPPGPGPPARGAPRRRVGNAATATVPRTSPTLGLEVGLGHLQRREGTWSVRGDGAGGPGLGERQPAALARQQLDPGLALEGGELLGDRARRERERLGGGGDRAARGELAGPTGLLRRRAVIQVSLTMSSCRVVSLN